MGTTHVLNSKEYFTAEIRNKQGKHNAFLYKQAILQIRNKLVSGSYKALSKDMSFEELEVSTELELAKLRSTDELKYPNAEMNLNEMQDWLEDEMRKTYEKAGYLASKPRHTNTNLDETCLTEKVKKEEHVVNENNEYISAKTAMKSCNEKSLKTNKMKRSYAQLNDTDLSSIDLQNVLSLFCADINHEPNDISNHKRLNFGPCFQERKSQSDTLPVSCAQCNIPSGTETYLNNLTQRNMFNILQTTEKHFFGNSKNIDIEKHSAKDDETTSNNKATDIESEVDHLSMESSPIQESVTSSTLIGHDNFDCSLHQKPTAKEFMKESIGSELTSSTSTDSTVLFVEPKTSSPSVVNPECSLNFLPSLSSSELVREWLDGAKTKTSYNVFRSCKACAMASAKRYAISKRDGTSLKRDFATMTKSQRNGELVRIYGTKYQDGIVFPKCTKRRPKWRF